MDPDAADLPDLVYVLGTGSQWHDNELRYSLRSAALNLPHRQVFISGECPRWVRDVIHLRQPDPYPGNKQANTIHKLGAALRDERIGKRVVVMNDDFFVLRRVSHPLPIRHKGKLEDSIASHRTKRGYYYQSLKRMRSWLHARGATTWDYGLHIPMEIDRALALDLMAQWNPGEGFMFRSAYGNLNAIGGERMRDCKVQALNQRVPRGSEFLSTSDGIVKQRTVQNELKRLFPTPSRYEVQ